MNPRTTVWRALLAGALAFGASACALVAAPEMSASDATDGAYANEVSVWQWSRRHSTILLGTVAASSCLAALWVVVLRRKVNEKTESLRESEGKFRVLVEQSLVGVYIIQQERFVYANPRLAEIFGYSTEELTSGGTIADLVAKEDLDVVRENIRRRLDGEASSIHYHCRGQRKDGSLIHMEILGSRIDFQGKPAIVGTLLDVTGRTSAEAALAEASGLLDVMLENSPDRIYFKDRQSRFVRYSRSFADLLHLSDRNALLGKSDFDIFTDEHARPAYEDEQHIIATGEPMVGKLEKETTQDGRFTWALTTKLPWRDRDGNIIGTFGISKDVTAIKEAEDRVAYEEELFRALLNNIPDRIYFKDIQSRFVRMSRSKAEKTMEYQRSKFLAANGPGAELPPQFASVESYANHLVGKTDAETLGENFGRIAFAEEQEIIRTGKALIGKVEEVPGADGKKAWYLVTKMPWHDKDGNIIGTFGISRDITALKEAESQLAAAQQRLLETSRLAGMAEVATDVLHNVGNVLNSVNVSCSLTMDRTKNSKMASLARVSSLLNENKNRLPEFFNSDPRGKQIPEYMSALSEHLADEQATMRNDLEQLLKHIDHIKQIVAMQQSYAKVSGVKEEVSPVQLVEDALHINGAALTRHDVRVVKEIHEVPEILTERHKVLQILVNLIRNAKYALDEGGRKDKVMTISVGYADENFVKIQVADNGVGIKKENLTQIFSHGFTTRRNGHGFGLHSSALAAKELGGSLKPHSDGPGAGATFTLLLPVPKPTPAPKQAQPEVALSK